LLTGGSMIRIPIGKAFETGVAWTKENVGPLLDVIRDNLEGLIDALEDVLMLPPPWIAIALTALVALRLSGYGLAAFAIGGLLLIDAMAMWEPTMRTLALVLVSTGIALLLGVPLGIAAARRPWVPTLLKPVLDVMQTMPAFVYLIPAVLFFTLGKVPGAIATIIFAMPPSARLTQLGITQVPPDVVEAARAFGSTPRQLLWRVQLPLALPTILAGVNQTIMLSLSMVVIAAMIGAGGLGEQVLKGITQLKIGLGFESGLSVVIVAMLLDRLTQSLADLPGYSTQIEA
jgi:glycine betaine/proline transport system permease protein